MWKHARRRGGNPERKRGKRTQGSETSQYLEENKLKSIPLVAASEKGEAQTSCRKTRRVVRHTYFNVEELQILSIAERFGKSDHRR